MNLMPEKCAARVSPPTLVIFYTDNDTGKRRRRSMPLRKFSADVNVQEYAEKLRKDKKNGLYVKLIPTKQLESVLSKIQLTSTAKQDKQPLAKLEPLELPSPVGKRGRLQPLTQVAANSVEDKHRQLGKSSDKDEIKPKYGNPVINDMDDKEPNELSSHSQRSLNDAINSRTSLKDTALVTPSGLDKEKDDNSLQLSTVSIPSEDLDGEDLENMTGDDILEKLIALPSNSNEEDFNKVSEEALKQKKEEMDIIFEQNRLQPGDEGYEYDKEVDYGDQEGDDKVSCGWDSPNSDIVDF